GTMRPAGSPTTTGEAAHPRQEEPGSKPAISCIGVQKSYRLGNREIPALRGVDLEIAQPGFYAIMGHSGSGKSTLLHLLASLDRPDAGEIRIGGVPIHSMDERAATIFRRRQL